MPTSTLRHLLGSRISAPLMPFPPSYRPDDVLIGTWSAQAIGQESCLSAFTSQTTIANTAYGYMFSLAENSLVRKLWWANGGDATGPNIDVGLYYEAGGYITSTGATAMNGTTNVVQEVDITDVLLIGQQRYWCVLS